MIADAVVTIAPFTGPADEVAVLNRLWATYAEELLYPNGRERGMTFLTQFFATHNEPADRPLIYRLRERLILVSMHRANLASERVFAHLRRR